MLPPFVRQQLDQIREATTHRGTGLVSPTMSDSPHLLGLWIESKSATEKLHLLVPNEKKRKNYLRLFKWVVSFATWRYGTETAGSSHKSDGAVDEAGYTLQVPILPSCFPSPLCRAMVSSPRPTEDLAETTKPPLSLMLPPSLRLHGNPSRRKRCQPWPLPISL